MNINKQVEYLMLGTEYGDDSLKQAMADELRQRLQEAEKEKRPLRIYCGYDPRKADLHLGHTITMRKLRQFQELGHTVIFLIGNYTSLIGDPSDKDKLRPQLSAEEIAANGQTYADQAFRILDPQKTEVRYNAEWLSKLTFAELIRLASNFTVQQFISRENFRLRWDAGDAVYVHELFYAIMQGYDAYALKCDVQIGGTDQLFNIVTAARKIMTYLGAKPNIGVILGILPGTDGEVKMSKSLGNHIPINTDAADMYGKVMSIPDKAMPSYFRLATRWHPEQIQKVEKDLQENSLHPRDAKMKLAWEIAASFYGDEDANKAQDAFVRTFQQKDMPESMPEMALEGGLTVVDALIKLGFAVSKSEARRLVDQNGVRFEGQVISEGTQRLSMPGVLQAGKRHFARLK